MVMMTLRTRKRVLLAVNVLLAAGLVCTAWAMAFGAPLAQVDDPPAAEGAGQHPHAAKPNSSALGPLEQYAAIYQRDLRQVLFDPPAIAARPAPKPKMPITLEGTAVEPGHSVAFIRTKSGHTKILRPGQTVDGVEILEILDQSVTVRFNGEVTTLTLSRDEGGS